jgi:hypothetical protein
VCVTNIASILFIPAIVNYFSDYMIHFSEYIIHSSCFGC